LTSGALAASAGLDVGLFEQARMHWTAWRTGQVDGAFDAAGERQGLALGARTCAQGTVPRAVH